MKSTKALFLSLQIYTLYSSYWSEKAMEFVLTTTKYFKPDAKDGRKIYDLVEQNDYNRFGTYIENYSSIDYTNLNKENILHLIAKDPKKIDYLYCLLKNERLFFPKSPNAPKMLISERGYLNVNNKDDMDMTAFHYATKHGNFPFIERFSAIFPVNINMPDKTGNTPLFYTLQLSDVNAIESILPLFQTKKLIPDFLYGCLEYEYYGTKAINIALANPNIPFELLERLFLSLDNTLIDHENSLYETVLEQALKMKRDYHFIKKMMEYNPITIRDKTEDYLLKTDDKRTIAYIGKEIKKRFDEKYSSYILELIEEKSVEKDSLIKSLNDAIKNDYPTTKKTESGKNVLHIAIKKGFWKTALILFDHNPLLAAACDNKNNTSLHILLNQWGIQPTSLNNEQASQMNHVITLLLQKTPNNVSIRNNDENAIFDIPMRDEILLHIIRNIPEEDTKKAINAHHPLTGMTPFLNACNHKKYTDLITILLPYADINKAVQNPKLDINGYCPLFIALAKNNKPLKNILEQHKDYNEDYTTNDGKTYAYILTKHHLIMDPNSETIKKIVLKNPAMPRKKTSKINNILHALPKYFSEQYVFFLLSQYPDLIHERNINDITPLEKMITKGNLSLLTYIMPKIQLPEHKCASLLCTALKTNNKNIIDYLFTFPLQNIDDPKTGHTPLTFLVENEKSRKYIKDLMKKGALIDKLNSSGNTILHELLKKNRIALDSDINFFKEIQQYIKIFKTYFVQNKDGISILQLILQHPNTQYFDVFIQSMSTQDKKEMFFYETPINRDCDCFLRYVIDCSLANILTIAKQKYNIDLKVYFPDNTYAPQYAQKNGSPDIKALFNK